VACFQGEWEKGEEMGNRGKRRKKRKGEKEKNNRSRVP